MSKVHTPTPDDHCPNGYYATQHILTNEFMQDLKKLYEKYNLCLAPTYEGEVSHHDSMMVIPFDDHAKEFLNKTSVEIKDE